MTSQMITLPMMSRDRERSSRHLSTLRSQYLKSSWRCYLTTITNYEIVCCEAAQTNILVKAWLLVILIVGMMEYFNI